MTSGFSRANWVRNVAFVLSLCTSVVVGGSSNAQFFSRGVVGGVSVDAEGVVQTATVAQREANLAQLRQSVSGAQGDLAKPGAMRMVSLKRLQEAILKQRADGSTLPEEILFLAGLQRVEYIFVYPEAHDIVLAGPAEGWTVRADGSVVGVNSARPVVQTEDLLTAFRTVEAARQAPISVSIEPTPEGSKRLQRLLAGVQAGPGFHAQALEPAMREAFGPQQVKFTTVPTDTRMARTLVAADYRMKLLAMNLEDSPVAGLPSYIEMIRTVRVSKTQPRWWIATQYDALNHTEDRLTWKLDGRGIQAMTEEELIGKDGTRSSANRTNAIAQKWADLFTSKFDELCVHNASFGELRNVIDLNVVATIIAAHQLDEVAGCDLSVLRGTAGNISTGGHSTPKSIPAHCSFIKGVDGWIVTASGGVEINPWQVVSENARVDGKLVSKRTPAAELKQAGNDQWWWD